MYKKLKSNSNNDRTLTLSIAAFKNNSDISSIISIPTSSLSQFSPIERWIDTCNSLIKDNLDTAIAKFFYRTAIPFNVADCKEWNDAWSIARPANKIPSSKVIRTTLLTKEYMKMKRNVQQIIQEASSVSIISDGWSNIRNEHLVNFLLLIPNHKPLFYDYIDYDGES